MIFLCLARIRLGLALILALAVLGMIPAQPHPLNAQASPNAPLYLPVVVAPPPGSLLIAAAHVDSALSGEADEAILLWNTSRRTVDLAGWQLFANGRTARFPASTPPLAPQNWLWCTAQAAAFRMTFGTAPGCEWNVDPTSDDPAVPNLEGAAPRLTNTGGVIHLLDPAGQVMDTLVYGGTSASAPGWSGAPAQVYTRGALAAEGQIYHRKLLADGRVPDQNSALDWAGDLGDLAAGRRILRPGQLGYPPDELTRPLHALTDATVTLAVGPEGLYAPLAGALAAATTALDLSLYTFEHPDLAGLLAQAAQRGVRVRLLLEGAPPGGVTDLQRWCVQQVAAAGGDVRYLAAQDNAPRGLQPRYRYAHAKYALVDGRLALVGTENFSWDSMPAPAAEPVGGRRGVYLLTDAAPVVERLARLFAADWSPDRFWDLQPYMPGHPRYGDPPSGYMPPTAPVYRVDAAPFTQPVVASGPARFMLVSAPENAVLLDDGLHALIQRAGAGDAIHLVQLYEHKYWGSIDGNPISDPNPRLQMTINAARRGATMRVLLDSYFDREDDFRSNQATVDYLNALAAAEGLDLEARLGDPTGGGIHAKYALVQVDGETWSAVGSLNGGEVSYKLNREVVLMVNQPLVYDHLLEVFLHDWARVTR
ncbi:MAG: hypothetical protein DCC57_07250 [Chloroflexi bacterium]|nr:MAG: hypothetical protein DCC57_07250 [Chloroflexota bacterium]